MSSNTPRSKNLLILYAEVMPYTVVVFNALLKKYADSKLTVVHYGDDKKLSNYQVPGNERIDYHIESENTFQDLRKLYKTTSPDIILCSGRMNDKYLKICKLARRDKVITVGNSDNHFVGSIRQRVAILFSRFVYRQYFDYMLVPGKPQYEYCRLLGFKEEQILFPQYCADVDLFRGAFEKRSSHNIIYTGMLYIGRLEEVKGIRQLIDVYISLFESGKIQEKLTVIGNGSLKDSLPLSHDSIEYYEYLPQEELLEFMARARCFILPSQHEPWGVVIHEAAAAGMPIVATTRCGAATQFVENGHNGFLHTPFDEFKQRGIIEDLEAMSQMQIRHMGNISHRLSQTIQPAMWGDQLMRFVK